MLAKMLAGAVEASFHRDDTGLESFGDFSVATTLLHEGEQRPIMRAELGERMAERIEFLEAHGTGWLGNVIVLVAKRQENATQFLAPELVDAGVAREPKEPRLKLRRRLQSADGTDHFDEDLLRQILHVIATSGHGVNKAGHAVLVSDNELPLGGFVALLSPADKVGQRGRCS